MKVYSPKLNKAKKYSLIKDWLTKPEEWFIFYMTIVINVVCLTAVIKLVQLCLKLIF